MASNAAAGALVSRRTRWRCQTLARFQPKQPRLSPAGKGILFGAGSVLLWSTSSVCTIWAGRKVGVWQLLAIACLVGGLAQMVHYRRHHMPLRHILLPPAKLWGPILLCFVMYMLVYTHALLRAHQSQKLGVNLANYLWPTFTILVAAFLVPGSKLTPRLLLALLLALAGVGLANFRGLHQLFAGDSTLSWVPYLLGLAAAVCWALYSAFLARWRAWAHRFPTAPLGFLITALLAFSVCLYTRTWVPMDASTWLTVVFMGLGPLGAGYLLWELALHRASPSSLGLVASATPVLSTVWLLIAYRFLGGDAAPPDYPLLLLAAAAIAIAVGLGAVPPKKINR